MRSGSMTTWRCACALILAGTAGACVTGGSACDGWRRIAVAPATAVYLVEHDRPAGEAIAGHNEHGRRLCGWSTGGSF